MLIIKSKTGEAGTVEIKASSENIKSDRTTVISK